jgi:predicted heme/steroid binding protein
MVQRGAGFCSAKSVYKSKSATATADFVEIVVPAKVLGFVCRALIPPHKIREQPAAGDGIVADRRLKLGHRQPRGGAAVNPLYQAELREVVLARPDHIWMHGRHFWHNAGRDLTTHIERSPHGVEVLGRVRCVGILDAASQSE